MKRVRSITTSAYMLVLLLGTVQIASAVQRPGFRSILVPWCFSDPMRGEVIDPGKSCPEDQPDAEQVDEALYQVFRCAKCRQDGRGRFYQYPGHSQVCQYGSEDIASYEFPVYFFEIHTDPSLEAITRGAGHPGNAV